MTPLHPQASAQIRQRVRSYLGNGGFWNPEMMDHNSVSGLIYDLSEELARLRVAATPAQEWLKQLVMTYDSDDSLGFLEALTLGRQFLGLKLADAQEEREDLEVLKANEMRTSLPAGAPTPPQEPTK